jgi:coenzyme F420-reducing hydrogenase delta subunit
MTEEYSPEVKVLYCGRTLNNEGYFAEGRKKGPGFTADFAMLPCSSTVEVGHLIKLIEQGADAVLVIACAENSCQLLTGSAHAEKRIAYARNLLDEVGIDPSRLRIVHEQDLSVGDLMAFAEQIARDITPLGRNPVHAVVGLSDNGAKSKE